MFSALKRSYRKMLDRLISEAYDDSSVAGKRVFLDCYQFVRVEALTEANCKAGWKVTGLWPLSMSKPLMSPLLLKNSNKPATLKPTKVDSDVRTLNKPILTDFGEDQVLWSTPRKAYDYTTQARKFAKTIKAMPTDRLFLRKVGKAIDEKTFELATCKRRIQDLEAEIDRIRSTKRRKVEEDPNTLFANIKTIRASQRDVRRPDVEDSDSEEEYDSDDMQDCIEVS